MHRFSLLLVNSSFLRTLNVPHKRERIPPLPLTVSKALLSETTLCLLNSVWYYLCIRLFREHLNPSHNKQSCEPGRKGRGQTALAATSRSSQSDEEADAGTNNNSARCKRGQSCAQVPADAQRRSSGQGECPRKPPARRESWELHWVFKKE